MKKATYTSVTLTFTVQNNDEGEADFEEGFVSYQVTSRDGGTMSGQSKGTKAGFKRLQEALEQEALETIAG